jgi:hypothetical protein
MTLSRIALILLLTASASGCTRKVAAPVASAQALVPPVIVATQPVARSTGVLYDTDIWVQFDRPLETSSVSPLTVYLKLDTQRLPITVSYEGLSRRILVRPAITLDLQKTYTVELSPRIRAFQGDSLGARAFFQFTTNSLRRVTYSYPAMGATEGPFTSLGWSGNGPINGNISYEIYAGTDSALVASRSLPYLQRAVFLYLLPRTRWPSGADIYWTVTAVNLTSGERLNGDLRRFRTYAADAPVDSVVVGLLDWGGRSQSSSQQQCNAALLSASPSHNSGMHFAMTGQPNTLQVAGARIELPVPDPYAANINSIAPTLVFAQNEWSACSFSFPGPPYPEANSVLGTGAAGGRPNLAVFESDAIAAFLEGQARRLPYYGFVLRSPSLIQYGTQPLSGVTPRAVVYYYRPGSGAPRAAR